MGGGLEDAARSAEISRNWHALSEAEFAFLIKPTRLSLKDVYVACDALATSRTGFWGESGKPRASATKKYYEERFGISGRVPPIEVRDIAYFFSRLHKSERLEWLALFIKKKAGYCDLNLARDDLKSQLNLHDYEGLLKKDVGPKLIKEIFSKSRAEYYLRFS
jgi:hypothetical protein